MDLDTFFVSVERLIDSKLKDRPIIIGGISDRGVVASCSYEARIRGVHAGMPMHFAKRLCPESVVIRGNSHAYLQHSELISSIIKEQVPIFEKTSIDEFYCDLTGMDHFVGCFKFATELRQKIIHESGLPISFGLSINKTVSKVATGEAKPNNQLWIEKGTERSFLAPLSVRKIPMVGEKTYQTLKHLGLKSIQDVQQVDQDLLISTLGDNGKTLWKKANGLDNSPVIAYQERKSISTERTFEKDTFDVAMLNGLLVAMTENLALQLRRGHKLTSCVTLKIRYADFQTYTMQERIPYSSSDHLLLPVIQELFAKLYDRRMMVRLIGVRCSHLVSGGQQVDLFDDSDSRVLLYNAMDSIRNKYGDRAVVSAAGMDAKTIGRKETPFNVAPPTLLANRRV
jgi:DNA polymerase-4